MLHCVSSSCFTDYGHYTLIIPPRLVTPTSTIKIIVYNSGMMKDHVIGCAYVNIKELLDQNKGTIYNVY